MPRTQGEKLGKAGKWKRSDVFGIRRLGTLQLECSSSSKRDLGHTSQSALRQGRKRTKGLNTAYLPLSMVGYQITGSQTPVPVRM